MKKLSLVFVILSISLGLSFAQTHISTVVESGVNQNAIITQTGPGDITSNVNQSNANNLATVTQINPNLLVANDILSDLIQSGTDNKATVTQNHNGNLASGAGLIQSLVNQSGSFNEAVQQQGPHGQQGTTYAEILQSGNWNNASQNQLKYGNDARINQSGNGNTGMQAQDAILLDDFEGSYNTAILNQSGNGNYAEQTQNGWANDVQAYQSGSGNRSVQTQSLSWVSDAFVSQSGNNNLATQIQKGSGVAINGRLNSARIEQASSYNQATQTQTSDGSRASAVYDPLNDAQIYQMGGDGNVATQTQTIPVGTFDGATAANVGIIWQNGDHLTATQTQTGGYNYGTVNQTGSYNTATVVQSQSIP